MSTDAGSSTLSESLSYDHVPIAPLIFLSEAWARVRGQYWLMVGISLVGLLLGSLAPFGLLMGPMMFGIFFCHRTLALGQPVSFEMLFKGFEHFLETFIATLLMIAASLVVVVPLIFIMVVSMFGLGFLSAASAQAHDHAQEGAVIVMVLLFVGIFLLIMAGSLLVGLLFAFTFPLMVDRGLKGMDAVKLSFRASRANFWGLLGLHLVLLVLSLVGVCFCYVGAFLVLPLTFGAHWIAYERVFGRAEAD